MEKSEAAFAIDANASPESAPLKDGSRKKDVEKDGRKREEWDHPLEFLFSCISLSVGLGNIWRFPFTAYKNGGGAFLIPYLIVLFLVGKPLYFLELFLGQFSSYGPIKIWKMAPILKGIGYGEMFASMAGASYYCAIMAVTIYYLINSFHSILPWSACNAEWVGECEVGGNGTMGNKSFAELYFEREVINQKESIEDGIGLPETHLTLCLLAAWILVFVTLIKGIKSSGKFSYFFAILPYIVLLTLLVRGATLPGAWLGVKYFITPQWDKLLDLQVWYAAVVQCFFSLGMGFGPIIMNASFNPFRHNVYRDAMIISLMDTFTSLLAGFTIFSILGNLAFQLDLDVSLVAKSGPGLAFISYPMAVSQFQFLPQLFAVLFFLMMLTLGVGTATVVTNGIITNICDGFPNLQRFHVTASVCAGGFLLGLIYVTPGGQFMITLVDQYGSSFCILAMAMLEVLGVIFIYGLSNVSRDIEFMLGIRVSWYWKICWAVIAPITLVSIFIFNLVTAEELTHNGVRFPPVALGCGVAISSIAIAIVPIGAIHAIYKKSAPSLLQKIKDSMRPSPEWGPMDPDLKQQWLVWKKKI